MSTDETVAADPLAALGKIRQRERAATPGPWEHPLEYEVTHGYHQNGDRHVATWIANTDAGDDSIGDEEADANAEFIAHARSDVDRLLRVAEAVRDLCRDTDGNWLEPSSSLPVGEFQAALGLLTDGPVPW